MQPDWVDLNKVAIPQADEQQRLLANLIRSGQSAPQAAAAVLVLAEGQKAVVDHDRRRPRATPEWRRASTSIASESPGRLLGGRLGVHRARPATNTWAVVHAPRRRSSTTTSASRWRCTSTRTAPTGTPAVARRTSSRPRWRTSPRRSRAIPPVTTNRTTASQWSDWTPTRRGRAGARHPLRHELLLLARRPGCRTGPACSPARACRCASRGTRRLDHRLLPGDDADDRTSRASRIPLTSATRCSRAR